MNGRGEPRAIWLWRAWTANRSRIADCGMVFAESEEQAREHAYMCLGGPHAHRVVEMQVEHFANGISVAVPPVLPPGFGGAS